MAIPLIVFLLFRFQPTIVVVCSGHPQEREAWQGMWPGTERKRAKVDCRPRQIGMMCILKIALQEGGFHGEDYLYFLIRKVCGLSVVYVPGLPYLVRTVQTVTRSHLVIVLGWYNFVGWVLFEGRFIWESSEINGVMYFILTSLSVYPYPMLKEWKA